MSIERVNPEVESFDDSVAEINGQNQLIETVERVMQDFRHTLEHLMDRVDQLDKRVVFLEQNMGQLPLMISTGLSSTAGSLNHLSTDFSRLQDQLVSIASKQKQNENSLSVMMKLIIRMALNKGLDDFADSDAMTLERKEKNKD